MQARETGICPVREELYAQCFDELIREVTINCAERGLLLLRVRDEMRMTISAYQTLYESAVAFGMRKALQTEQGKSEMEARMQVRTLPVACTWFVCALQYVLPVGHCCTQDNDNAISPDSQRTLYL